MTEQEFIKTVKPMMRKLGRIAEEFVKGHPEYLNGSSSGGTICNISITASVQDGRLALTHVDAGNLATTRLALFNFPETGRKSVEIKKQINGEDVPLETENGDEEVA